MIALMITAALLGLAGGLIPGPVLAATFARILQAGFTRSLGIVLWALLVESAVAIASLVIMASAGFPGAFFDGLSLIGAGVLVWIAIRLWRIRRIDNAGGGGEFGPGKVAAMILLNGVLWTYWITVCIPQAMALGALVRHGEYLFLALVQIGWLLSTLGAALAFSRLRRLLSHPRLVPMVFRAFALAFGYFALMLAWAGARSILQSGS